MATSSGQYYEFGPFRLDRAARLLLRNGEPVALAPKTYDVLALLVDNPGRAISKAELLEALWPDTAAEEGNLAFQISTLRKALGPEGGEWVLTVPRHGYRFRTSTAIESPETEPLAIHPGEDLPSPPVEESVSLPRHGRARIVVTVLLAGILLLGPAAAWYYWRATRPIALRLQPLLRLEIALGNEVLSSSERGAGAILSPDGTRLVYISQSRLFTRPLDQAKATEMAGTQGALAPFFSPDGQWVAFFASAKLKKVSIQGGPAIDLCDAPLPNGGSWGEDGNIIASIEISGLSRIPSGGGTAKQVTELAPGETIHRWPQILPGGRAVLFSAYRSMTGLDGANIEVMSWGDRRRKTILRGGTWGRYLPTGHLVYINKGVLFAVAFDPDRLEVRGTPMPVLEGVAYSTASGSAELDFSRTGALIYQSGRSGRGLVTVQWLDDSGKTWPVLAVPGNYLNPVVSPDGKRLAITSAGDIWVYDLGRENMMRITIGGGAANLLWSADGQYIAFRSAGGIFWTRADGTGDQQQLTQSKDPQMPWSFSADGKRLAFVAVQPASGADLWTIPVESTASGLRAAGNPEPFLQTSFDERSPMFSPGGRWLAYCSNKSGDYQIYVQAFPDKSGKKQISSGGGLYPAWSRNGREIFFRDFKGRVMVASYTVNGDSFLPDKPRLWSGKRPAHFSTTRSYDPAPDGNRIVALMPAEDPREQMSQDHLVFLLHFFDELRRRIPTGENRVY